jgi:hypothetical protein
MHWIEGALALPLPPRRAWLQAFGLVSGVSAGLLLGLALGLLLSVRWAAAAVALGLLVAGLGLVRPQAAAPAYRAWARLSGLYQGALRVLLKWLAFQVLRAARGPAPRRLALARSEAAASLWVPRRPATEAPPEEPQGAGWIRRYLAWAHGARRWALALLPFLIALAAVDDEIGPDLPSDNYTLY